MDETLVKSQYERLSGHFQACVDLSAPDRDRYIAKLADSDPTLGKELRELLRFHEDKGSSASGPGVPPTDSSREGTRSRRKKGWISASAVIPAACAGVLAILFGMRVWVIGTLEGQLQQETASSLKASLDLRLSHLRSWQSAQTQAAQKFLQDPILVSQVSSLLEAVRPEEAREIQKQQFLAHPSTAMIAEWMLRAPAELTDRGYVILSASGLCLAADFQPLVGDTLSADGAGDLGRVNLGETFISRPYPDRIYSRLLAPEPQNPVMCITGPIRDVSGRVIASCSFKFSPTRFYELLSAVDAEFVAFDSHGQVLNNLHVGPEAGAWGLPPGAGTAFRIHLRDPGADLASGKRPETPPETWPSTVMARSAVQGQTGTDASGHRDFRGQRVVAAWTWLPDWGMGIGGQMPVDRVLAPAAPVHGAFTMLIGIFVVLTAGSFAGMRFYRIRRRSSDPSPFGAYVVERPIGKGGMAEVFLARHAILNRPAALKILSQQNPDPATVERFEREARLASRLAHPNTVQIFDFGETSDGRLFTAMEYVDGLTLAQFLALEGLIPVRRAVFLLQQVAGSLGEAHRLGLLHRDLKPSNIMLSSRAGLADIVKVLDFGVACSIAPNVDGFTQSISLIGTPAFLPPERILAPRVLDFRSDIYAFGAVGFHLLTGRNVFEGTNTAELIYQILTAARPSPSRMRGEKIPDALERLVLSCLSVEPEQRPSSVQDIETELDSIAAVERWTQAEALAWWSGNRDRIAHFLAATR